MYFWAAGALTHSVLVWEPLSDRKRMKIVVSLALCEHLADPVVSGNSYGFKQVCI